MAPTTKNAQPKAAKPLPGQTKKPFANRPVVQPAIPLPLMQKQQQQSNTANKKHAPTASVSSNGVPASSLEAALIDRIPTHASKQAPTETTKGTEKQEHAAVADSFTPRQMQTLPAQTNGNGPVNHESQDSSVVDADSTLGSSSVVETAPGANGDSAVTSPPHSAISTSRPEFPPVVPSSSRPMHQHPMADQHRHGPFHAQHHMHPHQHRQQLSNGGTIMFGGFGSHTPSPGPPPGGFMPPPLAHANGDIHPPRPNGHHHSHTNSNGFPGPIDTHFRGDMVPVSTMDPYAPMSATIPPPPFEPMHPGMNRYGPPTPHSFHGSHNSGEPNGVENGPMPYPPMNMFHPPRQEHHINHPPPPPGHFQPFMHPQPFTRPPFMAGENVTDTVSHIRAQFDNKQLADCILELSFCKGQHSVKVSGHKLILAQSPTLKYHIKNIPDSDSGPPTIAMVVDDPHLRSDAWCMALQRLYMHPLLEPQPIIGSNGNGMDFAGNKLDRFSFCLGYAAAGYHLGLQDVLVRGLHIAGSLLTWATVEAALGFVLESTIQRQYSHPGDYSDESNMPPTMLEFNYGPETKIIMAAVLDFLVNEFPSNFELDTSVSDPAAYARFPTNTAPITAPAPVLNKTSPAIARGTNMRQSHKSSRLPNIKFGDLPASYPEDGSAPSRQAAKCSSVLSRILLNLPYDQLCQVLASGSSGVSGWNTAQERFHAIAGVVAEREVRRLRALQAFRNGPPQLVDEVSHRLSAPQPYTVAEEWDGLNWQEKVMVDEGPVPRILRRWVPQFGAREPSTQQQTHGSMDSMV